VRQQQLVQIGRNNDRFASGVTAHCRQQNNMLIFSSAASASRAYYSNVGLWDRYGRIEINRIPILETQVGRASVLEVFSNRELLGEFNRRGGTVRASDLSDKDLWGEIGRRRQARRRNRRGGRPRKQIDGAQGSVVNPPSAALQAKRLIEHPAARPDHTQHRATAT
jgi:hypothetical protein